MARSQHPFSKSLIHENEIARGHAKTVSQSESINLIKFVNSERGMPKYEGQSEQQGAPRILTEVNYYYYYCYLIPSGRNGRNGTLGPKTA